MLSWRDSPRELVPHQAFDGHVHCQAAVGQDGIHPKHRRLRGQVLGSQPRRSLELLGESRHSQLRPVPVEHPGHEEVSALEGVAAHVPTWVGKDPRHGGLPFHHGHVAVLAGGVPGVGAVLPFQVRRLLRELSHLLTVRVQGVGEQGVAAGAELGALNVDRLPGQELRRRPHDPGAPLVNLEGAVDPPLPHGGGLVDGVAPREALPPPQVAVLDLMADGAGNAVHGQMSVGPPESRYGEVLEGLWPGLPQPPPWSWPWGGGIRCTCPRWLPQPRGDPGSPVARWPSSRGPGQHCPSWTSARRSPWICLRRREP
jgi:hypothetical protein